MSRKCGTGIGVLGEAAWSRNVLSSAAFLRLCVLQWATGREGLKGPPLLQRYANSRFGRPPDWRRVGGSKP